MGKTTTAVNLSAAISRLDRRVLLIDLDPQSNATVSLGVPPDQQKDNTSYGLLNGAPFRPIELSPNFHLVPSNIELAGAEMELTSVIGREIVLRDALAGVTGYDFMILDCSPSLGLLSVNALTTAKEVMVPLQCEFLALHGISLLMRTIDLVRKRLNTELSITGVIPCMYDLRKGLARDVVVEIEKHFGNKVFKTKIRSNVRLAEAPSHGKSIFDYAPDSYGAEDYLNLAREIVGIEMIQRDETPRAAVEPIVLPALPADLEVPIAVPELVTAAVSSTQSIADAVVAELIAPSPVAIAIMAPPIADEVAAAPIVDLAPLADPIIPEPVVDVVAPPVVEPLQPEPMVAAELLAPPAPTIAEPAPVDPGPDPIVVVPNVETLVPAPEPEPVVEPPAPTPDIVSDGVVEFIELIPLEIEDLPFIEPERTA